MMQTLRSNALGRQIAERPVLSATVVVILFLVILPQFISIPYYKHVLILVMLFGGFATCWNLMGGYCGLLALGNVAFFGLGAYSSTLFFLTLHMSPWIGMAVGALVAAIAGVIIGYPTVRLKGAFFALASMAFSEVLRITAIAWQDLTGGSKGIAVSFKPGFENMMWTGKDPWYYLALIYVLVVLGTTFWITRNKLGYYAVAVREDDAAARMLGINTARTKVYITMIAAAFTAVGGSIYAQYMTFLDPYIAFDPNMSVQYALITIAGGQATLFGPILGAMVMVPLSEFLQGTLGGAARGFHLVAYGALLILVIMFMPNGAYPALVDWYRRWRKRAGKAAAVTPVVKEGEVDVA